MLKAVKLTAAKRGRIVAESASEAESESTSSDGSSISDEENDYDLVDTIDFDTEVSFCTLLDSIFNDLTS